MNMRMPWSKSDLSNWTPAAATFSFVFSNKHCLKTFYAMQNLPFSFKRLFNECEMVCDVSGLSHTLHAKQLHWFQTLSPKKSCWCISLRLAFLNLPCAHPWYFAKYAPGQGGEKNLRSGLRDLKIGLGVLLIRLNGSRGGAWSSLEAQAHTELKPVNATSISSLQFSRWCFLAQTTRKRQHPQQLTTNIILAKTLLSVLLKLVICWVGGT